MIFRTLDFTWGGKVQFNAFFYESVICTLHVRGQEQEKNGSTLAVLAGGVVSWASLGINYLGFMLRWAHYYNYLTRPPLFYFFYLPGFSLHPRYRPAFFLFSLLSHRRPLPATFCPFPAAFLPPCPSPYFHLSSHSRFLLNAVPFPPPCLSRTFPTAISIPLPAHWYSLPATFARCIANLYCYLATPLTLSPITPPPPMSHSQPHACPLDALGGEKREGEERGGQWRTCNYEKD